MAKTLLAGAPQAPALLTAAGRFTYSNLKEKIDLCAERIHAVVANGEVVAVCGSQYEWLYPFVMGAWQAGVIPAILPAGSPPISRFEIALDDNWRWREHPGVFASPLAETDLILATSGSRGVPKAVCLNSA